MMSKEPDGNVTKPFAGLIRIGFPALFVMSFALFWASGLTLADEPPRFFRGLNLNGPPVVVDGYQWEGADSKHYLCNDRAFDVQTIPLVPATDPDRARMIRSSRWGGNRVEMIDLPPVEYSVFLYVWEDNNSESYSITINGRRVLAGYNSGTAGHWDKLGPFYTNANQGRITIKSLGGAANFSGVELWAGRHDGHNEKISEDDLAFFEKRIRPVLAKNCYRCHSEKSKDLKGGLLVDSRATLRRGGAGGPSVVPGHPEKSLLIEAVRYENPDMEMPPDEKLSDEEIADLERWVKIGAPDPRSTESKHLGKQIDIAKAQEFWSFRPIVRPKLPTVKNTNWPSNDIDRFVLAKMEEHRLTPAPDAAKRALIRRATFDLTGLPPTPEEVQSFLQDNAADAYEKLVNRLLDSPRYGERWGRHWLDVVRYADTAGDNSDYPIPQIRLYRDWVIQAFNRDMPYDAFVRDQLAGDLVKSKSDDDFYQKVIATGYLANSRRFGSRVVDYPQHLTIEDTIDNLGRTFLGMSLACARCHDHKFDPFTARNYYGLYGIFSSTRYPWPGIELDKRQHDFVMLVPPDKRPAMEKAASERTKKQNELESEVQKLKAKLKKSSDADKPATEKEIKAAEARLNEHVNQPALFETAYAVQDMGSPYDAAVQIKGDPVNLGDIVPRHFPAVLGGEVLPSDINASGRKELAEWLVSEKNPLPARVMANRVWQHHFGRGIVPTPNDFGKQGKPPTHPELLDYLATEFRKNNWSVKSLHRLIMMSHTYRQSSTRDEKALSQDPSNEWLSGFPRLRLDAESLRDSLLMMGGNLDLKPPAGEHPFPAQNTWKFTQHNPFKAVYESNHRSVYLMTQRIQRHPFLAIFDGADPSTSTAARMTSTTPLQALYLLNNPFVHQECDLLARRILKQSPDTEARVQYAYELMFARPAEPEEIAAAKGFLEKAEKLVQSRSKAGQDKSKDDVEPWRAYVRALIRLNEFVYID